MIPDYIVAGMWGAVGSFALLLGSFFGYEYNISKKVIAFIAAFSSGILISAVCFEILNKSYSYGDIYPTIIGFIVGIVLFTATDTIIHKFSTERYEKSHSFKSKIENSENNLNKNSGANNDDFDAIEYDPSRHFNKYQVKGLITIIGALLDGIPEAIAIGLIYFIGGPISMALLIAIFIANSFEGASASLNMRLGGWNKKDILGTWILVIALTATSAMLSYIIFSYTDRYIISGVLGMTAGAFLAMIADTMLPEAFNEIRGWTGFVMSLGFLLSFYISYIALH